MTLMVEAQGRLSNPSAKQMWVNLQTTLAQHPYCLDRALLILPNLLERKVLVAQTGTKIQRQVRLGEADIIKLVDDYRSGLTVMELSRRYSIHRTTVMDHLRRKGVPKQCPKLTREQIAQAKYLRNMGMSYQKIGAVFGVDAQTIANLTR